jgi:flavin-dependent dehydrogenase
VALLEAHSDPATFKRACTHFIQPSGLATLQRLGLDVSIAEAGGVVNTVDIWSPYGWITSERSSKGREDGYNIRRSVLDPMLRQLAGTTPGVDLFLGHKVSAVIRDGRRIAGVVARRRDGTVAEIRGRLTVGADGRNSAVAAAVDLPGRTSPHGRFGYSAHYTGVLLQTKASSQFWLDGSGMNFVFSNDAGRSVVGVMRPAEELPAFRQDLEGNLLASFDRLPRPPGFENATRVSDMIGMINYPGHRRRAAGDGVALVGDAALVADYLWGVGCGWALQSAEWLVDATAAPLLRHEDPDPGAARYARRHKRRLAPHYLLISDFATGRPFNAFDRLFFSAATVDDEVANAVGAVGARLRSPLSMLTPSMLLRMVRARARAAPAVDVPLPRSAVPADAVATDAVPLVADGGTSRAGDAR